MCDAAAIFRDIMPLMTFRQFSAHNPQFFGCSSHATARQQEYESYKADYPEELFETMVERCQHLTVQQARSHFDFLRAQGKLQFLGVKSKSRGLVPVTRTGQLAVQPSKDAVAGQGFGDAAQSKTAQIGPAHGGPNTGSCGVAGRLRILGQPTMTTPSGTSSSVTLQHTVSRGHDTRTRSLGSSFALGSSLLAAPSNRRRSADGRPIQGSQKNDELANRYRSTAEATSMFQPPAHRLSPTAPEFVPRLTQASPPSSPGSGPADSAFRSSAELPQQMESPSSAAVSASSDSDLGLGSAEESRPRPRRKDSWEDDWYLAGVVWDKVR
ncbi:hypothetical protein MMC11_003638 [Xylographa trunciseda]|nr:hypothetical protein [Xylographa trunciseda]